MLPGSTGMPKCSIRPPACSTAAGITSRRSTMTEAPCTSTISAPASTAAAMTRRQLGGGMVAALLGGERRAERREPRFGDGAGLVEDAFLQPRQPRLDQRDPARREGGDPQQRPAFGREGGGARDRLLRHRERDDLDRRDHLARLDDREGRQGAERHGLVDEVEPVEPVAVEDQEAARLGEQIGAAGEGRRRLDIGAGDGGGDPVGRLVLAQIARIEPGRDDIGHPRRDQRLDIGRAQDPAFLERGRAEAKAVRQDRARRLADRDFAESHTLKPTEAFAPDRYVGASAAPG